MEFKELQHKGVFEILLDPKIDERGFFMRTYDEALFSERGLSRNWVQENHSFNAQKGTIRGLHLQIPPHAESKLIRVISGEIFFAFVDLRKNSATFSKWGSAILSIENKKMLFVPEGFALGACVLQDGSAIHYKMSAYYAPDFAETIAWNDSDLNISWPIQEPSQISFKDAHAQSFKEFLKKHGSLGV